MQVVDLEEDGRVDNLHVLQVVEEVAYSLVGVLLLYGQRLRIDILNLLGVRVNDYRRSQFQSVLILKGCKLLIEMALTIWSIKDAFWVEVEEIFGVIEVLGTAKTLQLVLVVDLAKHVDEVGDEPAPVLLLFSGGALLSELAFFFGCQSNAEKVKLFHVFVLGLAPACLRLTDEVNVSILP